MTAKQALFLAYECDEAMFGGARGPGKSEALLVAALQYINRPNYHALVLRRTYPELSQAGGLMDKAHSWLKNKAKWNEQNKTYYFPDNSTLQFGFLESDKDKYRYQGGQYDCICVDELGQFEEFQYKFLFGSLRKIKGKNVPTRMRSACNPGAAWVKKRFIDYAGKERVFVPALFTDNEYLDLEDYEKKLNEVDPVTRAQWKHGDWSAVASGRFKADWLKYWFVRGDGFWVFDDPVRGTCKAYSPLAMRHHFLVVDPAATVKTTAKSDPDFTAISTFCVTPCGSLVWLSCRLLRCEMPDIIPAMRGPYQRYKCTIADVESGGMQKSVGQLARRDGTMNINEFTSANLDKLNNALPAIHMMEGGRVWLPAEDGPEFPLDDVRTQILMFDGKPNSAHDDAVDNLARAARRVMTFLGEQINANRVVCVREGPLRDGRSKMLQPLFDRIREDKTGVPIRFGRRNMLN